MSTHRSKGSPGMGGAIVPVRQSDTAHANPARARWPGLVSFAAMAALLFCSNAAKAQIVDSGPSVKSLKQLSIEELMDIEVTSVSKQPEKLLEAASAIQVITQDEIRRAWA